MPQSIVEDIKLQQPFVHLTNQILAIAKSTAYLKNRNKQDKIREYEKEIDERVYNLYNLTPEEIAIVERNEVT